MVMGGDLSLSATPAPSSELRSQHMLFLVWSTARGKAQRRGAPGDRALYTESLLNPHCLPTVDEEVKGPQRDRVTQKSHSW